MYDPPTVNSTTQRLPESTTRTLPALVTARPLGANFEFLTSHLAFSLPGSGKKIIRAKNNSGDHRVPGGEIGENPTENSS